MLCKHIYSENYSNNKIIAVTGSTVQSAQTTWFSLFSRGAVSGIGYIIETGNGNYDKLQHSNLSLT